MNSLYLQAAFAAGRVDADDPQLAELALAGAAIAEGKRLGPHQRFFHRPQQSAASARVALGLLKKPILLAPPCGADGGSHRRNPSLENCSPRPPRQ